MARDNESLLCIVSGKRKGGAQNPCQIMAGFIEKERLVVLRTADDSGVPPIVALLDPRAARELGDALIASSEKVE